MANITGTSGSDLVHRTGDGHSLPGGWHEFATATTGADTINTFELTDEIYSDAGNDTIDSGGGDDYIEAGDGADSVTGGAGNDTIIGGQGADILRGDTGTDIFRITATSDISNLAEVVDGGSDEDLLDFGQYNAFGAVNLTSATLIGIEDFAFAGSGNVVTLTADQLGAFTKISAGFATDRFILSAAGTVDLSGAVINELVDEFRGTNGNDIFNFVDVAIGQTVNTLAGTDKVYGALGNDKIDAGAGADVVAGNDGDDIIKGGDDNDKITGNAGNDTITGGKGTDSLSGGTGNDVFLVSNISEISGLTETINGGDDTDKLQFDVGGRVDLTHAKLLNLEQLQLNGNDITITAEQLSQFNAISASFSTDRIILAAAGTVDLSDATISALLDELRGSSGNDRISYASNPQGLFVDARAGNDSVLGGEGDDRIVGWSGNDTIHGGFGNDTLDGGSGADKVYGGDGNDVLLVKQVSDISGQVERIDGGNDVDELNFVALGAIGNVDLTKATIVGMEKLSISGNVVTMTGAQMAEFETIAGGFGTERLIMSTAGTADLTDHALALIDEIRGSSGNDKIYLTNVANGQTVNGMGGTDTLRGGNGNDILNGGASSDVLSGSGGDDILTGGSSADKMTGGAGIDTFVFSTAKESPVSTTHDTITDFVHGTDLIDVHLLDAKDDVAGDQAFTFIGSKAFSGHGGELRYVNGIIYGEMTGDKTADFEIELTNKAVLTSADFTL